MEFSVYELQRKYDEFKDLNYDQLMKIAELNLSFYNQGRFSAMEDDNEDKQNEIDNLKSSVDELELENETLTDKIFDLKEKLKELQKEKDTLQSIVDDTVFKKVKEEVNKELNK